MRPPNRDAAVDTAAALKACDLFAGLPASELAGLARLAAVREYAGGDYLFHQGDRAAGFFVVLTGELNVHRVGADGREQVLHMFSRGDVCGEVPVFQGTTYPASARAASALRTVYVGAREFREFAGGRPDMLLNMLAALSRRLRKFVELIDDLSLKDVSARVAGYLLALQARSNSDTLTLPMTKTVLAASLGTVPETLSRTLRRMREQGLIDMQGRRIGILDRETLLDLSAGGLVAESQS